MAVGSTSSHSSLPARLTRQAWSVSVSPAAVNAARRPAPIVVPSASSSARNALARSSRFVAALPVADLRRRAPVHLAREHDHALVRRQPPQHRVEALVVARPDLVVGLEPGQVAPAVALLALVLAAHQRDDHRGGDRRHARSASARSPPRTSTPGGSGFVAGSGSCSSSACGDSSAAGRWRERNLRRVRVSSAITRWCGPSMLQCHLIVGSGFGGGGCSPARAPPGRPG